MQMAVRLAEGCMGKQKICTLESDLTRDFKYLNTIYGVVNTAGDQWDGRG